ncbi:MAG: ABC transporter permease [Propioniciclava sp.]
MSRRDSLTLRYAQGDLRRNPGVNVALVTVLLLGAFLMATGAMVTERLVGSINQLFDEAQPPHFLQMHSGDYDEAALDSFAASQPAIEAWTVVDLLGFDGSALSWERSSTGESGDLSASLIDNLFVSQNPDFDYLLDEQGEIAQPRDGEAYAPVAYQRTFGFEAGDEIGVRTDSGVQQLEVVGFVRDAQMASSLSSATRFLVSESQWESLAEAGGGDPEIIIEYLMQDPAQTNELQTAYERDDALPKNGQAVTFEMIRIINTFSDGLVAVALVFASLLLIVIALINLRFVIRGTLQDEVRKIGAMKAIGLPDRQICRLYLSKYSLMTVIGCVIGGVLAVGATVLLTGGISSSYSSAPVTVWTVVIPLLALAAVYAIVVSICRGILRGIRRIEVVNALVHGSTLSEGQRARAARRSGRRVGRSSLAHGGGGMNGRLLRIDLLSEFKQWMLLPLVFFLVATLMTLPANLLSTFESPRFVTSMGAPESDLRADIQFSDDVDAQQKELVDALESDDRILEVRPYANVLGFVDGEEGPESLRIETGDYTGSTIDYISGSKPADGEIAVSVLNAEKYALAPGDEIKVTFDGVPRQLRVSGLYQDVTSGGYTAKMQGAIESGALSYVVYLDTAEGEDPTAVALDYQEEFPEASVVPMREYTSQTLAYVTDAFRTAAMFAFVFGIGVALLITALFLKLQISRDRRKMGVLSAIGFSAREIAGQIRGKSVLMAGAGVALGVLFSALCGGPMVGGLLSLAGLGIVELNIMPTAWVVYGLYPLSLIGVGYLGAVLLTASLPRLDKSAWLK